MSFISFISFRNERPKWRTPIWKNPWKIVPLQENQHKTWVFLLSPTRSTLCALRQLEANKRRIKLCNSSSTPSFSVLFFCMSLFIHPFFSSISAISQSPTCCGVAPPQESTQGSVAVLTFQGMYQLKAIFTKLCRSSINSWFKITADFLPQVFRVMHQFQYSVALFKKKHLQKTTASTMIGFLAVLRSFF